jgi:hypothetical protein
VFLFLILEIGSKSCCTQITKSFLMTDTTILLTLCFVCIYMTDATIKESFPFLQGFRLLIVATMIRVKIILCSRDSMTCFSRDRNGIGRISGGQQSSYIGLPL